MNKQEFEEKWQGKIRTNKDWNEYKFEIWKDIEEMEHENRRRVKEDENVYYYTKGDANNIEDDVKLEFKDLKGKVLVVIPYVGYPNVLISEYRSRNNGE